MTSGNFSPFAVAKMLGLSRNAIYFHCYKIGFIPKETLKVNTKERAMRLYNLLSNISGLEMPSFEDVWTRAPGKRGRKHKRVRGMPAKTARGGMYEEYLLKSKDISIAEKKRILIRYNAIKYETQEVVHTISYGEKNDNFIIIKGTRYAR